MGKLLWKPSEEIIKKSNMTRYINFVNKNYGKNFATYWELYNWSIENIEDFWRSVWDFVEIKAQKKYKLIVDDLNKFPGAKWFVGAELNYAENLLRFRDEKPAFVFRNELGRRDIITYRELYERVLKLAQALRRSGVKKGDRVVGYMPNLPETAISMLATTAIGAIWSSCATDIGPAAVVDRFGQIEPVVLFTVDGYFYKGKPFSTIENVSQVVSKIPSIKKVIITAYKENNPKISSIPNSVLFNDFIAEEPGGKFNFEYVPVDHPIFIMFSSGTTGKPKCMVQGSGVLINHLKELIIHTDLKREDVHFFITTCSWMMWNWVMSSLATGNTIVLYDGNPNYPDVSQMWREIEEEKVTMFGCSATYINYIKSQNYKPKDKHNLTSLREIWQTGSPLSGDGFEYVYREVKEDLHFNSSSGGTDINGCFFTGSNVLPVYAGELQSPALGMKVKAYDENGNPVYDREGELVCEAPSPSMPLYFWNDMANKKYLDSYFNFFKNKNVWRHGDYIVFHSDTGGATFYGRSDSVLKPSGVRIGTSEIYNIVEKIEGIEDSVVVGQNWKDDQRIILFVKLSPEWKLTNELKEKIKNELRTKASPRHVPAKIIQVPEIPYTMNMKKVESAITNIVNGRPVTNRDALMNPQALDYYEKILDQIRD
jgi:acetoacetyl-CoA synthetase